MVAADEKEGDGGIRATLNLGHTFGHAIETGMGYGTWLRGEAVAAGLVMAADLSCRSGLIPQHVYDRAEALLVRTGLPTTLHNGAAVASLGEEEYAKRREALTQSSRFLELMAMDKKVSDGQLSLVLLQGSEVGGSIVTNQFQQEQLSEVVADWSAK